MLRNLLRVFRRSPLVTISAVAVLGLGFGLSLSVFSVLVRLLSPVPPGIARGQYMTLGISQGSGPLVGVPWLDFVKLHAATRDRIRTAAASSPLDVAAQFHSSAFKLKAEIVSSDYFQVLGIQVAAGRAIESSDETASFRVAVVRQDLARKLFGAPERALGQSIVLAGEPFTIVGIVSPPFAGAFSQGTSVWLPPNAVIPVFIRIPENSADPSVSLLRLPGLWARANVFYIIARSQGPAGKEPLTTQIEFLRKQLPETRLQLVQGLAIDPEDLATMITWARLATPLALSFFLVAALNFGAFEVAQLSRRRGEMKLRQVLGANLHHLFVESLRGPLFLLTLAAAAGIGLDLVFQHLFRHIPLLADVNIDWQASIRWFDIGTILLLAFIGLLIVGGLPVSELLGAQGLAWGQGTRVTSSKRLRTLLLGVLLLQGAIALVSVLSALFLVKAMERQQTLNPEFQAKGVIITALGGRPNEPLILAADSSAEFPLALHTKLALRQLSALPEVKGVAAANVVPLSGSLPQMHISPPAGGAMVVSYDAVSADYFRVLGIRILQGATFSTDSFVGTPSEAIVNASLARALWPDKTAIGQIIQIPGAPEAVLQEGSPIPAAAARVVGVVSDARYSGPVSPVVPLLYLPLQGLYMNQPPTFVIRASTTPETAASDVRNIFGNSIPGLDVTSSYLLKVVYDQQLAPGKVRATVGLVSGFILLILALIGAYGVASFHITARERESAIRICLGAQLRSVMLLALREVVLVAAADIPISIAIWILWSRFLAMYVLGVRIWSPSAWMQGTAVWLLAMLGAAAIPAIRLAKIQPAELMRLE
jgi:putative ABC transport system permease protein